MADELAAHLDRVPPCADVVRALVGCLEGLKLRGLAELAAGAAHEINNPLAIISGQAQHLLKSEESPERIHALQRIVAQSRRIHGILNDLMLYARPPRLQRRMVNLSQVVQDAAKTLADLALERRVRLDVSCVDAKLRLHADPQLLGVAVECLIRNGVEAAPAEGWVRVATESSSAGVEVVVEDNGPGLNGAQREHLFDPFYSGRSAGRGVGLGLSKAWRIAQLHAGSLDFQDGSGRSTRFVLCLPAPDQAEVKRPAPRPKPRPKPRPARRPAPRRRASHAGGKQRLTSRNGKAAARRRR